MSVTGDKIRGKNHQDKDVPRNNPAISQIHKNIKRQIAHTIVSWPNPKQWQMGQFRFDNDNKIK